MGRNAPLFMHWNPSAAVSARKEDEEKMTLKKMLIVSLLVLCALAGRSESITIGDFTYSYSLSTKEGSITKYNGSSENVVIPSTFSVPETYRDSDGETHTRYHTIKVVAIGSSVFEKNIAIRSVTFARNLKSIGGRTFSGCTNLTEISSIEGMKSIGTSAFYNCYRIPFGDLVLDDVESIGDNAFVGCNIRSLRIGDKLGSMGIYAFESCGNLKGVEITGNGNCKLNGRNGVFNYCTALESVVFGDGIAEASSGGSAVLLGCYALKDVSFGARITSIPGEILKDRKSLRSVSFSPSVTSIGGSTFSGCTNLTEISSIEGMKSIGAGAFYNCYRIPFGDLVLDDVESIGDNAFVGCNIRSLRIGDKLGSMGIYAFESCGNLKGVEITGNGNCKLNGRNGVFNYCTALESVVFGDGIAEASSGGSAVLLGCYALKDVSFGARITSIPGEILKDRKSLRSVSFSPSVTSIGGSTFSGCTNLTEISSMENVKTIGSSAFRNCSRIMSVEFGPSLTSIGQYAFSGCGSLRCDIVLPCVTSIGDRAFEGSGIRSVKTSESLTYVGSYAFGWCGNLVEAEINGTNLNLGSSYDLFYDCQKLQRVIFGDGVTKLCEGNGIYGSSRVFINCTNLQSVAVGRGVTVVPSYFLSKCGNAEDKLSVSFASLLTIVGSGAFNNGNITNLDIRLSNCIVGSYAFNSCSAVNTNNIDFSQVISIGDCAFEGCGNIRGDIDISNSSSLGIYAFAWCGGLTSVNVGSKITYVEARAFYGSSNISLFRFSGAPPKVGTYAFSNVKSGAVGTYTAAHTAEWEAVIDSKGYWNGLKMKPSYYTVIYDANNGTGARTTATVEWGEPTPAGDGSFTWEAHYFMGWAFAPDSGSTLGSNDVIPEPQEGNTVTLYGQWATFEPVAADWSAGSITLKATGVAAKEGELVWLSYCDASGDNTSWQYVDNSNPTSDDGGQSIIVTDSGFSSRLGGISAVNYRFQVGTSLDDIRVTMSCTTRTKRGIFVGVGEFGNDYQIKPKPLPSASVYAERFRDLMESRGKMAESRLLTNGNATYEKVGRAFLDFADIVKPGDVCIVYFSTHGGVVPYSEIEDTTIGSLCLYDKPPAIDDPLGVGYHEALLANHIRMLDPKNKGVAVVNIISACHSGAFFDDSNEEKMCGPVDSWCHKEDLNADNVAWITAASYKSSAYSYFDKFLIHYGWDNGWADTNNDEIVSFLDLANYTKKQYDDLFSGIVFENETESKQAQIIPGKVLDKIIAGYCVSHGTKESPSKPLNVQADKGKSRDNIMMHWDDSSCADEYCIFYRFGERNGDGEVNPYVGIGCSETAVYKFEISENDDEYDYECFLATTQTWPSLFIVKAINGKGISEASTEAEGWVNALLRKVMFNGNGGAIPNSWDGTPIGGSQYQVSTWVLQGDKLGIVPTADKVGFTLCGWFNDNQAATPETVIQDDVTYTARWTDMTVDYLSSHPTIATASCGNIATAANMVAANGCRTVGECYALGIDPEDPNDDLKIAEFKMKDGKPEITLNHTKDGSGNSFEDRVKVLGKAELTDAEWQEVPPEGNPAHRFFKVGVEMP